MTKRKKKNKKRKNNYAESNKNMKCDRIEWTIPSSIFPTLKSFAESIGIKIKTTK